MLCDALIVACKGFRGIQICGEQMRQSTRKRSGFLEASASKVRADRNAGIEKSCGESRGNERFHGSHCPAATLRGIHESINRRQKVPTPESCSKSSLLHHDEQASMIVYAGRAPSGQHQESFLNSFTFGRLMWAVLGRFATGRRRLCKPNLVFASPRASLTFGKRIGSACDAVMRKADRGLPSADCNLRSPPNFPPPKFPTAAWELSRLGDL